MALIVKVTGQKEFLPHTEALVIYKVLTGEMKGTKEQQDYCLGVKDVYLNSHRIGLPSSYIKKRPPLST